MGGAAKRRAARGRINDPPARDCYAGPARTFPARLPRTRFAPPMTAAPLAPLLLVAPLLLGPAAAPDAAAGPPPARPNVVVILADDMGLGDVRAFNPDSKIPTPHLDRLAAGGIRLTDAHAPAAWCTPTRYSLLTGRYPFRGRPWKWDGPPQIAADVPTLPGLFRGTGYRTAMVGKWHLGFVTPDGGTLPPHRDVEHRGGPVDRGFDRWFGITVSLDGPPYYYVRDRRAVVLPTDAVGAGSSPGWSKIQGDFWRAGRIAPGFAHQNVLPDFRDEAVKVIKDAAAGDAPFFLYLALASPHTPWAVTGDPAEYKAAGGGAGLYGQFVGETDAAVGRVLAALDDAGVAENTLVVFTSDNGPVWYDADEETYGHAAAGFVRGEPVRGMKGDAYEGGHRVPFIARGPGVPAGASSDAFLMHTDLLPTLAAACGLEAPAGAAPDAVNGWPALRGEDVNPRTEAVFESTREGDSVRVGDWKLIPWLGSGGFTPPRRRDPAPGEPAGQLYDLAADPGEATNLYADRPDKVAELAAAMDRILNSDG